MPVENISIVEVRQGPVGPAGTNGTNGTNGSDATVTAANTLTALQAMDYAQEPAALVALGSGSGSTVWDGPVLPRTKARIANEAAAGSVRPFRLKQLVMGDSYGVNLIEELKTRVAPIREVGFGITMTTAGGAATDTAQWTRTPVGGTIWRLSGAGHSVEYGGGTAAAAVECYRVKCFYQVESGGGTFALETNTNEAGWVEVPGATTASPINTNNGGAIGCGIFTYSFSTGELRRLRAKWISGTVRILGFVLSDIREDLASPRGGCAVYKFDVGGITISNNNQCPQAIWDTILQNIEPDFVTIKGDDSNWTGVLGTASTDLYQMIQTARPMDWIMVGRHPASAAQYSGQGPPDNSSNDLLSMDREMRGFAIAQGQLWVNSRKIMPPYSVMTAATIIAGDNTHLSPRGQALENEAIMRIISTALAANWEMHKPDNSTGQLPRYSSQSLGVTLPYGPQIGLAMLSRTNSTASGSGYREVLSFSKVNEDGGVGIHVGRYNEMRVATDTNGRWFFSHGTNGFGQGIPAFPRYPSALMELHSANRTTVPVLSLSGSASFSASTALMQIRSGADITSGTEGTVTLSIYMSGRIAPTIPTYANDAAADADALLLSGQLYKVGRVVSQKP